MKRMMWRCLMAAVLSGAVSGTAWAAEDSTTPAPPPLPDLVSPSNMPTVLPSAESLALPGGLKESDLVLPELPLDMLGASATPSAEPAEKGKKNDKKEKKEKKEKGKKEEKKKDSAEPTPTVGPEVNPTTEPVPTAEVSSAPTSVPSPAASSLAAVGPAVAEGPLTGLEAYFPMRQGRKWTYSNGTASRTVECTSRELQPGGAVKASFRTTEGAEVSEESYLLKGGTISLSSDTEGLRRGWIRLQTVTKAAVPRWTYDRRDGTASYYKAETGAKVAGDKTYPDCVTVTERTLKGAQQVSLVKYVYARGVGLVAVEVFGAENAPLTAQSWKLVEP
jgi:hypothetical protein